MGTIDSLGIPQGWEDAGGSHAGKLSSVNVGGAPMPLSSIPACPSPTATRRRQNISVWCTVRPLVGRHRSAIRCRPPWLIQSSEGQRRANNTWVHHRNVWDCIGLEKAGSLASCSCIRPWSNRPRWRSCGELSLPLLSLSARVGRSSADSRDLFASRTHLLSAKGGMQRDPNKLSTKRLAMSSEILSDQTIRRLKPRERP